MMLSEFLRSARAVTATVSDAVSLLLVGSVSVRPSSGSMLFSNSKVWNEGSLQVIAKVTLNVICTLAGMAFIASTCSITAVQSLGNPTNETVSLASTGEAGPLLWTITLTVTSNSDPAATVVGAAITLMSTVFRSTSVGVGVGVAVGPGVAEGVGVGVMVPTIVTLTKSNVLLFELLPSRMCGSDAVIWLVTTNCRTPPCVQVTLYETSERVIGVLTWRSGTGITRWPPSTAVQPAGSCKSTVSIASTG
jgi:hypothetical protein